MKFYNLHRLKVAFLALALISSAQFVALAQGIQTANDPKLTIERIFGSPEFRPESFGGFRWLKDGESFAKFEPSPTMQGSMDLVRYPIETNKRDVLLPAEKLVPAGETKALLMHGYDWSADEKKLLIYTNS